MSLQIVQNQQLKPIGDKVPIDTTLSSSSENAISNKAVTEEITRINSDLSGLSNKFVANINQVIFTAEQTNTNIRFNINNTDLVVWKMDWVSNTIQLLVSHDSGQTWSTVFSK